MGTTKVDKFAKFETVNTAQKQLINQNQTHKRKKQKLKSKTKVKSSMVISRSNPQFSLLIVPFLFLFFFCSSNAATPLHHPSTLGGSDVSGEKGFGGVFPWETRRFLEVAPVDNNSLILAERRTYREDPTDGFKKYAGGWNISNNHYWASVGFTAVPFFAIAAAWFLIFGITLSLVCLCYCCCRREPYGYSRVAYALSLIFLILFTIAAIVGCIVLYTGQGKFHNSTSNTLGYVVNTAINTSDKLNKVSGYLDAAKQIGVDSFTLPADIMTQIDGIKTKINSSATTLSTRATKNSKTIRDGLDGMRFSLIILAAVMLFLAFLGFLCSVLGFQCIVYTLVVLGWILVAGTFILCGVFLLLHNVVADTCVAMDEWVTNPTAHTALDDILPCVDNATARETLLQSKDVTYQLVNLVNMVINNVTNQNVPPQAGIIYFNQSGPLLPNLCNPFNSDTARSDRQCTAGEASLDNATEVWKKYMCEASPSGVCRTTGRLNPTIYGQMEAAVNVSYGLYHYGPFLVELVDCTFARQTFTDISDTYCPGLRRYTQWIYIGLVMVSAAVMLSLIFWVIYARERRHRVYTKQFMTQSGEHKAH